jgi:cell division inhibitor SepF
MDRVKSWLFAEDEEGLEPLNLQEETEAPRKRSRLIPLHPRAGDIFIRRPRNQDEAKICVDCLRGRRAVVVNLKDVQPEDALRVFDFLTGACYAVGGQVEQAGDKVYLVTPQNIGIMAEETSQVTPRSDFWQEI